MAPGIRRIEERSSEVVGVAPPAMRRTLARTPQEQEPGSRKNLMDGAIAVVTWHLNEARRMIDANRRPEHVADAELLLEWLLRQEAKPIGPRAILQLGPGHLRDKKRRDAAIKVLADRHWLFESSNPAHLVLNPKARIVP